MSTRGWLERQRRRVLRREGAAMLLALAGLAAAVLALGVLGARVGAYRRAPELALAAWVVLVAAVGIGAGVLWRRARRLTAGAVAAELERRSGLRPGALAGLAGDTYGSPALAALADRRMAGWLGDHGHGLGAWLAATRRKALGGGLALALGGVAAFVAVRPTAGTAFWRPVETLRRARGPVTLEVSRAVVRRGDTVDATVTAGGRASATLFVRAAGEPWRATPVGLDSAGRGRVAIGPLDSDRYLHATSGGRGSDTVVVRVHSAPFLTDLALLARYPAYLARPDEPLAAGPDTVLLPVGTVVETRGRASATVAAAAWVAGARRVALAVDGAGLAGRLPVRESAAWTLEVTGESGLPLEGEPARLVVRALPDSAPVLAVPVPGGDTTAPTSLRQPLVVDVRDDIGVARVEVISRRVSRLGVAREPVTERIPLPDGPVERAVLSWQLDLNSRGFLPGDTAFYRVRAWDGAPQPHMAETREYALRLPSLADLRELARAEARALAAAADSVARAQRDVSQRARDLARERERDPAAQTGAGRAGDERLGYRAAERAAELTADQRRLLERAEQVRERLDDLVETAWEAGLTDPEWHRQLAELRELLQRAVTPEMEETLRQLEEAMRRLDAAQVREALERLAALQDQLRAELERSRQLFERAALEGDLTSLAADAAELAQRQHEWTRAAEHAADSAMARAERMLAARADSLGRALEQVEGELAGQSAVSDAAAPAADSVAGSERAQRAAGSMAEAADAAADGRQAQAVRAGDAASQALDPLAESLRQRRDALREQWRAEVLDALDRALVETAQLAGRQEQVQQRLRRGESGSDVRAALGAARDGVDRVLERLQGAAGKNALISPALGAALGFARAKMDEALSLLQQAVPNTREAEDEAGQALDGLNALATQLVRSRADVAGAQSGSGVQEALERMAQLAQQQGQMAGQAGAMLPLMALGGQMLMQELQALARQQRQMQAELERLRAQGEVSGTGELADEAGEIARRLEEGVLDRETVERQERLYRRLLDRGRTLRGEEADEEKERTSRTGSQDDVLLPRGTRPAERGPRFRYPTWEQLQHLSPGDRRLILDYFRRLNEQRDE